MSTVEEPSVQEHVTHLKVVYASTANSRVPNPDNIRDEMQTRIVELESKLHTEEGRFRR